MIKSLEPFIVEPMSFTFTELAPHINHLVAQYPLSQFLNSSKELKVPYHMGTLYNIHALHHAYNGSFGPLGELLMIYSSNKRSSNSSHYAMLLNLTYQLNQPLLHLFCLKFAEDDQPWLQAFAKLFQQPLFVVSDQNGKVEFSQANRLRLLLPVLAYQRTYSDEADFCASHLHLTKAYNDLARSSGLWYQFSQLEKSLVWQSAQYKEERKALFLQFIKANERLQGLKLHRPLYSDWERLSDLTRDPTGAELFSYLSPDLPAQPKAHLWKLQAQVTLKSGDYKGALALYDRAITELQAAELYGDANLVLGEVIRLIDRRKDYDLLDQYLKQVRQMKVPFSLAVLVKEVVENRMVTSTVEKLSDGEISQVKALIQFLQSGDYTAYENAVQMLISQSDHDFNKQWLRSIRVNPGLSPAQKRQAYEVHSLKFINDLKKFLSAYQTLKDKQE